MHETMTATDVK